MVKRKANPQPSIGLDSGRTSPGTKLAEAPAKSKGGVSTVRTTGEEKQSGVTANRGDPNKVHVAKGDGLGTSLFWSLLKHAGYEAW